MPLYWNGTLIPENVANALTVNGVNITAVVYNGTSVWSQSLGPTTAMFYGGGYGCSSGGCIMVNTVCRINSSGAIVGSETAVGTARQGAGGGLANLTTAVYYGGFTGNPYDVSLLSTRVNVSGAIIGSETSIGTKRYLLDGCDVSVNALFYGGVGADNATKYNKCTRISSTGAIVGSETTLGTARVGLSGAGFASIGVFFGGYQSTDLVTRIDSNGAIVGTETNVGSTNRAYHGGCAVSGYGVYYAGYVWVGGAAVVNKATKIDSTGVIVGTQPTFGTSRYYLAGGTSGTTAVFHCGADFQDRYFNTTTRCDVNLTQVGSETAIGSGLQLNGGTGVS